MRKKQGKLFEDYLDTVMVINRPARENLGEDSFYCAKSNNSAIVSVFDGCGGLGSRKYESFRGHTGAYIASRTVSGAVHDWYHRYNNMSWKSSAELAKSLDQYIREAYKVCEPYGVDNRRIMGSMVRKFPTTLALAYAEKEEDAIRIHLLWAGDSRVYLLDEKGLAQLTRDDTDVEDAFENLTNDGPMNNVLSSDGNYGINYKSVLLSTPTIVFAATDGCFGYIPTPMEFEYHFLKSLADNRNPVDFKDELCTTLADYAGDDLAMGMMSFYYGTFENTRRQLAGRLDYLTKNYIELLDKPERDYDQEQALWNEYKPWYERYLK